jgi:hypothetical protein
MRHSLGVLSVCSSVSFANGFTLQSNFTYSAAATPKVFSLPLAAFSDAFMTIAGDFVRYAGVCVHRRRV